MQQFQNEGIHTYDQKLRKLRSLGDSMSFDTPKHHVTILGTSNTSDVHPAQADCTILMVAPDNLLLEAGQYNELSDARQLIVLLNKMYTILLSLRKFSQLTI